VPLDRYGDATPRQGAGRRGGGEEGRGHDLSGNAIKYRTLNVEVVGGAVDREEMAHRGLDDAQGINGPSLIHLLHPSFFFHLHKPRFILGNRKQLPSSSQRSWPSFVFLYWLVVGIVYRLGLMNEFVICFILNVLIV